MVRPQPVAARRWAGLPVFVRSLTEAPVQIGQQRWCIALLTSSWIGGRRPGGDAAGAIALARREPDLRLVRGLERATGALAADSSEYSKAERVDGARGVGEHRHRGRGGRHESDEAAKAARSAVVEEQLMFAAEQW